MVVTAIIPALNEEISIGSIVIKTKKYVNLIIVVDDGSTDSTAEIAKNAGAEVIRHPKNKGKGEALKTGFQAASENGSQIIVTIDGDGQNNPDEIPKLLEPILAKDADIVIGSRFMNGNGKTVPFHRRIGQIVLDQVTNIGNKDKITDSQSGFRAFSINTVPVFRFGHNGFSIESEMIADAIAAGLKIKEVGIGVRYDVDGSTQNFVYHGLKVFVNILHDMEFRKPLYYFTLPGIVCGTVGLGMGLTFLQKFYNGGSLYFGPTLLMLLLTLVGLSMTFTGIVLHAISGIMHKENEINKKLFETKLKER